MINHVVYYLHILRELIVYKYAFIYILLSYKNSLSVIIYNTI